MIREERMGPHMLKLHIEQPGAVIHHFTEADHGDPHDHPWQFNSRVLWGSYVEEVFTPDGVKTFVTRVQGDFFYIPATHIHRIVHLPLGECLTVIFPRPPAERTPHFWRFEDGVAYSRPWHQTHWDVYTP